MNSFQERYGNITLWEFNERRKEFKREYEYLKTTPNYREQIREFKDFIYGLTMAEYKKDKMWEFLNDDLGDMGMYEFTRGVYSGWFGGGLDNPNKKL